jgi:hypothetical protein
MKYGYCLLLAVFAVGCASVPDQPRAESRKARPQQTEQVVPTGATPEVVSKPLPSTMSSGDVPLNFPVNSEQTTVASVETETPAPVRPRRRVEQQVFYGVNIRPGGTLRLFSKEYGPIDFKIEEVWLSDGRKLVRDDTPPPTTPPEHVLQGSEETVWYASLGAWCQTHKLKLGVVFIMLLVVLLCVLVRKIYNRAPARRYRDEPPQRGRGNGACLPPHSATTAPTSSIGLMTKEQFEAAIRAERLNVLCSMNALDLDLAKDGIAREKRRRNRAENMGEVLDELSRNILAAQHDAEIERCAALEAEYDSYRRHASGDDEEDNDDDLFEETPSDDDEDRLSNSQTSDEVDDDDLDNGNS